MKSVLILLAVFFIGGLIIDNGASPNTMAIVGIILGAVLVVLWNKEHRVKP